MRWFAIAADPTDPSDSYEPNRCEGWIEIGFAAVAEGPTTEFDDDDGGEYEDEGEIEVLVLRSADAARSRLDELPRLALRPRSVVGCGGLSSELVRRTL